MASPGQSTLFTTFTELVSTTYRNHSKEIADNVSNHNALFKRLTEKGKIRLEDGGLSIVQPLDYASNSTYQRYSGFDVLNVQASELSDASRTWFCQNEYVPESMPPTVPVPASATIN